MSASKYVTLNEGENVIQDIEGPAILESPNPITRAVEGVFRFIAKILGFSSILNVIATDQRVYMVERNKVLYFLDGSVTALSLTKGSILSVGYELKRSWLIFSSTYLVLETKSNFIKIRYKGTRDELNALIGSMIQVVNE